jgi:2,3-bisphosphoglycerate-dependent phosphoglycerate mutase
MLSWPETLTLVRHGESFGNIANAEAYAAGAERLDLTVNDSSVELSELGGRQARALGARLGQLEPAQRPTVVVVSSYVRAQQTADHVLDAAGLDDVVRVADERLRDREQGILDRLTGRGIRAALPDEADRRDYLGKFWYRPPGGESWADVALRIRSVLRDIRADYADERVLVVTHDVPILLARYVIEGLSTDETVALSRQIVNCGMTTYHRGRDGMWLEKFNDPTPVEDDDEAEVTAHE